MTKQLSPQQTKELIAWLKQRFEENMSRHQSVERSDVQSKLEKHSSKMWSLYQMEETGGEPDVVEYDDTTWEYMFYDCCKETPKWRRSLCYDREALESRKKFPPKDNVIDVATRMGIELLTQDQYICLQSFGEFDTKTSSRIKTPDDVSELGGLLFADFRYGQMFVYHNGAESYYASRWFRGVLRV